MTGADYKPILSDVSAG